MNKLVWKLLRQHISIGQLTGFFLANIFGMLIVLLSVQFYKDVLPVFTQGDSFMKKDYIIATKKISTLGSITGQSNTFSKDEIKELEAQPFTRSVGAFTPTLFKVSAGLGMEQAGIRISTDMFFESVPDEFVDVSLDKWHFDEGTQTIPIIIPRNYLNLYNFGFAQSRNLPKLSEGVMGLIQMDTTITDYFQLKNYETEGDNLDAGKTTYFLRLITGIVSGVGLFISILSFYILMLSVFLLLQKNTAKLENLLLIGYSPSKVALPYHVLTVGLNLLVLILAIGGVAWLRSYYTGVLQTLIPQLETGSLLPCILAGSILFIAVSALNILLIRRKVLSIWKGSKEK